jgi:indole-3-glycerol phosphate synthase
VNLATTEILAAKALPKGEPDNLVLVAESGIHTRADVVRVEQAGARAILVGESLMRGDIATKAAELLG